MSDQETREKIIDAARVLFADLGYEGASVREIAKAADVNVASVNYYFNSKENLYLEIIRSGYRECAQEFKELFQKNKGHLEDTLVDFFRYFVEHSHDFRTHFKLMMSADHSHNLITRGTEDGSFGPPGGKLIAEILRREAPHSTEEDVFWALKTLFAHVTHLSLIYNCLMKSDEVPPYFGHSDVEKSIRRLTSMVLSELKDPRHIPGTP
jgi:AcrR family transcriptional regulator